MALISIYVIDFWGQKYKLSAFIIPFLSQNSISSDEKQVKNIKNSKRNIVIAKLLENYVILFWGMVSI